MNDPRVTHYALGELNGEEREVFEKELATSVELQEELKETVGMAELLQCFPAEEGFSDEEREALRSECRKNLRVVRRNHLFRRTMVAASLGALAACLLLAPFSPLALYHVAEPKAIYSAQTEATREGKDKVEGMPVSTGFTMDSKLPTAPASVSPLVPSQVTITTMPPPASPITSGNKSESNVQAVDYGYQVAQADTSSLEGASQPGVGNGNRVAAQSAAVPFEGEIHYGAPIPADARIVSGEAVYVSGATLPADGAAAPQASRSFQDANEAGSAVSANAIDALYGGTIESGVTRRRDGSQAKTQRSRTAQFFTPLPESRSAPGTENYEVVQENTFLLARENPLSTFSVDVDTASYANVRRFLQDDQLPPAGAIRTEEMINYFTYKYAEPKEDSPFSVNLEVSRAPWDAKRELVRIALKGRELPQEDRPPANLVFLIDVSGSMDEPNKLPLLKKSLKALVENLAPRDQVAIVVYAGSSGLVLSSTPGTDRARILQALDRLDAGGSTNGGAGIRLAYQTAQDHFIKGGNNRVILCTDGDFNVGTTSQEELTKLIERERASGIFLSVLGFGTGNLKDATMERLADKGNGNYAYIDSFSEGRKVLVEQMSGTLFTIAKDVKIQVEFNPARVAGYRLIGYENRLMAKEDFNNDKKDAGEIGAGHTVTALYEIIPAGELLPDQSTVDPLKYQRVEAKPAPTVEAASNELLTVKLRYKAPDGDKSQLLEVPFPPEHIPGFEEASVDFQFAAAVGAFGMKLRGSPAAGELGWSDIKGIVRRTLGEDPGSYRAEFLTLIEKAARLSEPTRE